MKFGRVVITVVAALVVGVGGVACGSESTQEAQIPNYQPAEVVREATGTTVLKTSDSSAAVHGFYRDFAEREDWQIVNDATVSNGASLTIKKANTGSTIAAATTGSTTIITISTYNV